MRGKDRAEWLADKICNGGDYAKEAALMLTQQADEIAILLLAEEGAKEAFGHVVQQKQDAEAECKRLRQLLDAAHAQIGRARTQGWQGIDPPADDDLGPRIARQWQQK